jgi:hypothetical protein
MNVRLHIERLVLDGLPLAPGQAPLVQAAVEAELARLIAGSGVAPGLPSLGAVPALRAGDLQLAPGTTPAGIGSQIARAVFSGIGGTGR